MVQTARDAQWSQFDDWMGTGGNTALIGVVLGAMTLVRSSRGSIAPLRGDVFRNLNARPLALSAGSARCLGGAGAIVASIGRGAAPNPRSVLTRRRHDAPEPGPVVSTLWEQTPVHLQRSVGLISTHALRADIARLRHGIVSKPTASPSALATLKLSPVAFMDLNGCGAGEAWRRSAPEWCDDPAGARLLNSTGWEVISMTARIGSGEGGGSRYRLHLSCAREQRLRSRASRTNPPQLVVTFSAMDRAERARDGGRT